MKRFALLIFIYMVSRFYQNETQQAYLSSKFDVECSMFAVQLILKVLL